MTVPLGFHIKVAAQEKQLIQHVYLVQSMRQNNEQRTLVSLQRRSLLRGQRKTLKVHAYA
jgi:hypothetical protein